MEISFARRPSSLSSGNQRKLSSAHLANQADDLKRRQSIKYQFPAFMLNEEEEAALFKEENVQEEVIRRNVLGPPLAEITVKYVDSSVTRPTTASSRRSVLWSSERKAYEEKREKAMLEFRNKPYMQHKYPELMKHYPGTWRVVNSRELNSIVDRLSRPTVCSSNRTKSAAALLRHRRVRNCTTQTFL